MTTNRDLENAAIMLLASRTSSSEGAIGLCSGARIFCDFPVEEPHRLVKTFYLSMVHETKTVLIGIAPTLHTMKTSDSLADLRKEARKLASDWNYDLSEKVGAR